VSSLYVLVYRLLELIALFARGDHEKELEILVLRHEPSILRRHVGQPRFEPHDRLVLATLSRVLPRRGWDAFLVRPGTLLRWRRWLVAQRSNAATASREWLARNPPRQETFTLLGLKRAQTAAPESAGPSSLRNPQETLAVPKEPNGNNQVRRRALAPSLRKALAAGTVTAAENAEAR
jgi:hypothetical protein